MEILVCVLYFERIPSVRAFCYSTICYWFVDITSEMSLNKSVLFQFENEQYSLENMAVKKFAKALFYYDTQG